MSVPAHTNQVGTFIKRDLVQSRFFGTSFGYKFDDVVNHSVDTALSSKSLTLRGDHRSATPYSRVVTRVREDRPAVERRVEYYSGRKEVDWTRVRPISLDKPTVFNSFPSRFTADMESCLSSSITRSLNGIRGEGSVQNGADIAEARQTANLMAQSFSQLLYAYRSAKRGNWELVRKHLGLSTRDLLNPGMYANRWLEYIYGWRPLMSSIYDNHNLLKEICGRPGPKTVQSARTGTRRMLNQQTTDGMFDYSWTCLGNARTVLNCTVDVPSVATIDKFGLLNPLSIAWEIVPFSFVIDWGIPVGDTLAALTATVGNTLTDGYSSITKTGNLKIRRAESSNVTWADRGLLSIDLFEFQRGIHSAFPTPRLYGKKDPFTTSHITNALALLGATLR